MDPSIFIRDFRRAPTSPSYVTFATGVAVDATANQAEPNQPIYIDVMAGRFSLIQIALPADHARALLTSLAAALPLGDGTVISITEPFSVVEPLVCSFCGDPHAQAKPCPSCRMPTCIFCLLSWSMRDDYPNKVAFSCTHAPKVHNR